jgi:hypothetical protein
MVAAKSLIVKEAAMNVLIMKQATGLSRWRSTEEIWRHIKD